MKKLSKYIPNGMSDYIFDEVKRKRAVENSLVSIFESRGYNEIITPTMEFFDVFNLNESYVPNEDMYKLFDSKGRTLALRHDMTTPISRVVATKLANAKMPIRLYYSQNVFRSNDYLNGKLDEVSQCGVELIGLKEYEGDIEVLITAISAMQNAVGESFKIELGHIEFFKEIIKDIPLDNMAVEGIRLAIEKKNFAGLDKMVEELECTSKATVALKKLPRLFGSATVLKEAYEIAPNDGAKKILKELETLVEKLTELGFGNYLAIDLGMVHHIGYYTGLIFRGYLDGSGENCLAGGRYDKLSQNFGKEMPATGFAISVNSILSTKKSVSAIRIAITKGRLEKKTIEIFGKMGIDVDTLIQKGRKLIFTLEGGKYEVVLAKAADVLTYVEHGVCDVGIVGKDTIMENGGAFYEVLDLKAGKCRFCVAGIKEKDIYSGYKKIKIATKYPNVSTEYFGSKGIDVEIIKIEGSVELAPIVGLSDAIVDIVETGSTLKENGLEVLEEIAQISARLIVNIASMKLKKEGIDELIEGMKRGI